EIVERAESWAPVGAGIIMSVNAMRVVRGFGIADDLAERGFELGRGSITDENGISLGSSNFEILRADHGPTIALHRAALHEGLLSACDGVPIALGTSVASLSQTGEGVDATLTDGRQERFDLVIGADGLRSRVRELTFGEVPIDYSGYTCWRLIVKSPLEQVEMREMWGTGQRFGIAPIGDEQLYCFAVANAPRGEADPIDGRLARFRKRFAGFGGQVPEVLAALKYDEELIHNDLEEVTVGHWFDGRVALLGDAAHAMTPNMGQGAAMALEDSAVLVEELCKVGPVASSLARWVARREPRVRWVQNQSRRIGRIGQLQSRVLCRLRNAATRLAPDRAADGALRKIASQPL
ncbi:MAG: 2-polyprenyl-6-methoxyphenol hydroxylase-like FAD-dependent oxidoreductase, partial [Myxococcota bacterium]